MIGAVLSVVFPFVDPYERAAEYEKPLHEWLQRRELGACTGGGTCFQVQAGKPKPTWSDLSVNIVSIEEGLPALLLWLEANFPDSTRVEICTRGIRRIQ